jgi:hypothetical protein
MSDKMIEQASIVLNQYQEGLSYKKQMGFHESWAEYERFRGGDQWPKPTNRTKDMPRPVFNVIDQIQGHKVSSVMSENIKMSFSATESEEGSTEYEQADTFTRFADTTWERIKQNDLNEEALDGASNVGTAIWHYYWDANKKGGNQLKYIGQMCGEVIDPVNFFPGNPQQRDVQKQPYNIITHRDLVENVREEAIANGVSPELAAMIQPDSETTDQAYDMAQHEVKGTNKVTVLTKYWRIDGYVHFMKVAGNTVVKKATNTNRKLYPLEVMQWKRRKKSIFGIGDTEGLIPNQKSINFLIAMQILSVQNTGWPKMLIKKGENGINQAITNTPGEVLVDKAPPGSWSAQYLQPGTVSHNAAPLVDAILQYTKEVSGANESAMGEQVSSDLNASAIMMLQKAAAIPIESVKRRFYQSMENIGRIWEEFWKVNYNTERIISVKNDEEEQELRPFTGTDAAETEMELKIDIGPSSSYSETLMMSSLDKLFEMQHINIEQYLTFAPQNVIPFKDRLLKSIQKAQEEQMMMQQQQEQMQAQQQQEQMMMQEQQAQQEGPHPFDQLLAQLPKHEQEAFRKMPPEEQSRIMQQMSAPQQ